MAVSERKRRELEQREGLILDVARRLFIERGFHGVTMDRIAEACEYSKGTIYGHFPNKEEIVFALATRAVHRTHSLFERAARFQGGSRERMMAIGEAYAQFVRREPEDFRFWQMLRPDAMRDKVSPDRQQLFLGSEQSCVAIVSGIVRDGISHGDLALPDDVTADDFAFGLWSLTFGAYFLDDSNELAKSLAGRDVFRAVRRHAHALMDGYGWKPLFANWDFEDTLQRIRDEVFPDARL
ncbi:MAG: helix-turn-helix domain-containing protein [Planctomycetota bacterium]